VSTGFGAEVVTDVKLTLTWAKPVTRSARFSEERSPATAIDVPATRSMPAAERPLCVQSIAEAPVPLKSFRLADTPLAVALASPPTAKGPSKFLAPNPHHLRGSLLAAGNSIDSIAVALTPPNERP